MLAPVVLDCAAIALVVWFVRRASRDTHTTLAQYRRTLDGLRAELVELVRAAEERGRALTAALDAREEWLHARVGEKVDAPDSASMPRLGIDPAEARLLRDLERTLPGTLPRP